MGALAPTPPARLGAVGDGGADPGGSLSVRAARRPACNPAPRRAEGGWAVCSCSAQLQPQQRPPPPPSCHPSSLVVLAVSGLPLRGGSGAATEGERVGSAAAAASVNRVQAGQAVRAGGDRPGCISSSPSLTPSPRLSLPAARRARTARREGQQGGVDGDCCKVGIRPAVRERGEDGRRERGEK